jgi:hypothetical protein
MPCELTPQSRKRDKSRGKWGRSRGTATQLKNSALLIIECHHIPYKQENDSHYTTHSRNACILIKGLIKNSASHSERRPSCHIRHFCNVMWPVAGVQEEPNFGYKIRHIWGFFRTTHVHHPLVACCVLSCVDWDPLGDVPYNNSATTQHILTFMQCTYSSSLQKLNFFCIIWSSHSYGHNMTDSYNTK